MAAGSAIYSQDFTVFGGSLGEAHAEKIHKVQDLALRTGVPIIGLSDGGGARIQEGVAALNGFGGIFLRNVAGSGVIPQISVVLGPSAGGAVYSPALTDFVFMVAGTSHMFITGPDVVRTVTGEEVDAEQLGGAMTHATRSGVAAFVASDERSCLDEVRFLLSFLPQNNLEEPPTAPTLDDADRELPELRELVPSQPNQPYDMKRLIDRGRRRRRVPRVLPAFRDQPRPAASRASAGASSASSPTSPRCSPVCSTSTPPRRAAASSAPATPSTSRSSPSSTSPASCPGPTRSSAGSSATAHSCSTPTARPPCRASR